MTKDEALRLALEALETLHDENMDYLTRNKLGGENNQCMVFAREAITAIKAALEAKDEPVAWAFFFEDGEASNELFDTREQGEKWLLSDDCLWAGSLKPLYTTPPQQEAKDEPVGKLQKPTGERAWFTISELNAWADKKLSENPHWVMPKDEPERDEPPPQRTWVGLSDEDKQDWIKCMPWPPEPAHLMVLIEGVELELKELNR